MTTRIFIFLFTVYCLLFTISLPAQASVDPRNSNNNIFGIHIIDANDLEDAARLVNSAGGDWGYVTIVIREDDRDIGKWQQTFDKMRELRLIPIVRLATKPEGPVWKKPMPEDADAWMKFLSSLNWVVQNRYVVLFNEPNHANEWGGSLNPGEYAKVARAFRDSLKGNSEDFFVLPAGFDVAAPNSSSTMDALQFFDGMEKASPGIFKVFDGWTSHSYPNPGFSGSPLGSGRMSIRSFQWELSSLAKFGVRPNLPVFITETGWIHKEGLPAGRQGKENKVLGFTSETVGEFFKLAFNSAWRDPRIVAVTPFVLNYQDKPFDTFSWKKYNSSDFYPQYAVVQGLVKEKGEPEQVHNSWFASPDGVPKKLVTGSTYSIFVLFKNTGQSIWSLEDGFKLKVWGTLKDVEVSKIEKTPPGHIAKVELKVKTPKEQNTEKVILQMFHNSHPFGENIQREIELVPPPSVVINGKLLFRDAEGEDFKLLLYRNDLVEKEIINLHISGGRSEVIELHDVVPGVPYRFVLLKSFYLPRQTYSVLIPEETVEVAFAPMLPLDLNNDGKFSFADFLNLTPFFK